MKSTGMPVWKEAPFVRLIIPFIAGILLQWYSNPLPVIYWIGLSGIGVLILSISRLKPYTLFKYYRLTGLLLQFMLVLLGGLLTWHHDVRNHLSWMGNTSSNGLTYIVRLDEPLTEKRKSWKTTAVIDGVVRQDASVTMEGTLLIYFKKDSVPGVLRYNSSIAFRKTPVLIPRNDNPGGFDHQQYCALQGIYYQVYLQQHDYVVLPANPGNQFGNFLQQTRDKILETLRRYIPGQRESGLAEALLIGYRNDLDKQLVQQYANTGVVHIIAISGLHIALIYWMLELAMRAVFKKRRFAVFKLGAILMGLWLFSFLAGGSPSVLRAAVMFTFIVTGKHLGRRTSVYNSLAASAFVLLCYNPYWLWDAGFQLSYLAVLSLVLFMSPLYQLLFIKNKLIDAIWKASTITTAAQILTVPLSIYYFHQFPNYFLVTNLLAVPVSSVVVLAEIALLAAGNLPILARLLGLITEMLICFLNGFINHISRLPFSTVSDLQLSLPQMLFFYLAILMIAAWLFKPRPGLLFIAIGAFCSMQLLSFSNGVVAARQAIFIVYNVPGRAVIGIVHGRSGLWMSDRITVENDSVTRYTIKPSINAWQIRNHRFLLLPALPASFMTGSQKLVLLLPAPGVTSLQVPDAARIAVVSGNPDVHLLSSVKNSACLLIFDSSNTPATIRRWKTNCQKRNLRYHVVAEKGAFIFNLN